MSQKRKSSAEDEPGKRRSKTNSSSSDEDVDDIENSQNTTNGTSTAVAPRDLMNGPLCGIIESVTLLQFMCHTHLEVKFGNSANITIGKNGSGKSALLNAVVIGLGGTARNTNRSKSVKDFIQQGKQTAKISVKLRNVGYDPYKPELYGNSIIVERSINRSGASSYAIRNTSGRTVSNQKKELNMILDYFNIQVDNPVSILNQELSRQFLHTENPKNKYQLFMKATLLEKIRRDYDSIDENRRIAAEHLKIKKSALPQLYNERDEWKMKYDYCMSLDSFKDKEKVLKTEYAWANIKSLEEQLKDIQSEVETAKGKENNLKTRVSELKDEIEELQTKCVNAQTEIESLQTNLDQQVSDITFIKQQIREKTQQVESNQMALLNLKAKLKGLKTDIEKLSARIADLQAIDPQHVAAEKQRKLAESKELEDKLVHLEACSKTTDLYYNQVKNSVAKISERLTSIRNEEAMFNNKLASSKRKLHEFEQRRGDQQKFGLWVPEVLKEIDMLYNKQMFRHKPLGPLGLYVKVREPKWALAIEAYLKSFLFAFYCDNHDDQKKLEKILSAAIKKYNGKMPMIITGRFVNQLYDVTPHRVKCAEHPAIVDVLQIENPVVMNCFIDECEVECILLIENTNEAITLMMDNPPAKCRSVFTIEAESVYPNPMFRFYHSRYTSVKYLGESKDDATILKTEIRSLEEKLKDATNQRIEFEKYRKTNLEELKATDVNLMRIRTDISQTNRKLKELKVVEENESVYSSSLAEDLRLMNQEFENVKREMDGVDEKLTLRKQELVILQKEKQSKDDNFHNSSEKQLLPLKESLIIFKNDLAKMKSSLKHFEDLKRKALYKVEELETGCRDKQDSIDHFTDLTINNLGPRPSSLRYENEIEQEMKEIEKFLKQEREIHGSKEEIIGTYLHVVEKVEYIIKRIEKLEQFLKTLGEMMGLRRERYKMFQNVIAIRVIQNFASYYNERRLENGCITFDHVAETLNISVQPTNVRGASQSMKSLSGGERSFSTVAFLLSLWNSIDCPFRMLDEFDVFMDMVNRRMCMDLLLNFAYSNPRHQFIFFTPLEITALHSSDTLRILRMRDPERNQSVLPFGRTNNEEETQNSNS